MPRKYTTEESISAFWSKVDKSGGDNACWIWTGGGDKYGKTCWNKTQMGAHRLAYILTHGDIPKGIFVLHKCDNPICVNPSHLFLGTQFDNMRDCSRKGRLNLKHLRGEAHGRCKLSDQQVTEIRHLYSTGAATTKELARMFSIDKSHVWRIVSFKNRV
jgi:hypothetical protein